MSERETTGVSKFSNESIMLIFLIVTFVLLQYDWILPVASGALDIHEVTVWMLDQSLQLVLPLFFMRKRMEQIFSQRHFVFSEISI